MGQTVEQLATISAASAADNSELSRNDPLFEAWDWTPSTVSSSTAGMPGLLPFIDFSPEGNSVEQPSAGQDGSLRELSNTIIHNGTLWEPNSLATPPLRKQRKSRARNGVPQLGEAGRAQLKSAISAAIRGENRKKMICREIGVLKSATIRQLILMANAIGLSHVVDDLVADFERVKEQKKILRPLKLTSCIRKRLSSKLLMFPSGSTVLATGLPDDWPIPRDLGDPISPVPNDTFIKIEPTFMRWLSQSGSPVVPTAATPVLVQGVVVGVDHLALPGNVAPYLSITEQGFLPLRMLPHSLASPDKSLKQVVDMSRVCGLGMMRTPPPPPPPPPTSASPRRTYPKLGNRGRAKLRGMIAAAAKGYSQEWKASRGIGSLKTARVRDLIRMAEELGLSEYVDTVALA
ncbi:hypothetical protein FOZ61_010169 [Perkinsus olseni]|uniref:Uncharacterized protein n=2 Tax=Perkinsus olseni TaxID=32597 RepID=A0A7J6MG58_PEROL|nr:hypothetical protein FOZ61_010169 [Perkinsus olseni]